MAKNDATREATRRVALIHKTGTEYELVTENGEPVIFQGRPEALIEEVCDKANVPIDADGKTPWLYLPPARGFERIRGTAEVKRTIKAERAAGAPDEAETKQQEQLPSDG